VIGHFVAKIYSLEEHVDEVLQAEAIARFDRIAEMEAVRAQNIIEHSGEIKSRPQKEWFASEKDKKKIKEAATEKAKLIKEMVGTGTHRMTRKKRRAQEVRQMMQEMDDEHEENGESNPARVPAIKKVVRDSKKELVAQAKEKSNKSIHDMDMEYRLAKGKKRKGVSSSDAAGDSSLFGDEKIAYAPKKQKGEDDDGEERVAKSAYAFRGFDAANDGKKKPKKKGVHKFKSKGKYKRRN
jgi:ATP-dependent RNA helicase DDX27